MSQALPIPAEDTRVRLLIVEPERPYLAVLARRFAELGFRVASAGSSHQAIAEFYRNPPALILTELKGRGFHCGDLIAMVRSDPVHRDLPILVLHGKSDHDGAAAAARSGADGVFAKPFHFEVLAARIERLLRATRAVERR